MNNLIEFNYGQLFIIAIIIANFISTILLKKKKLYDSKIEIFLVFSTILAVYIGYIFYTPYWNRQHDTRNFVDYQYGGHFGYIGYIFFNKHLPTVSPKDYWCFYNPPLFYIISAIFMKIQTFYGLTIEDGLEGLQFLSALYTIIFDIYVYRIMKEINIKRNIKSLLYFVALSPAIIIMSGSLNNDILSIMLSTMSIFYCIRWYKSDSLKDLIKIAFTISLAMMTKISSAIIAVAIAFVFLTKVLYNKKDIVKYIKYFSLFALISLPIGLWFPIKNLIIYDVPLNYVQSVDENNPGNVSKHSVLERIFTISDEHLTSINDIDMGDENPEYNLFITTLKSFIVDEYIYCGNSILQISIPLIFYCSILIAILFIINLIYILKNYKKINNKWILFFLLLFILEIISYVKFCFDFPYTFTMNFRYIVPTLISYSAITGTACEKSKKLFLFNSILIEMFVTLSVLIFISLV